MLSLYRPPNQSPTDSISDMKKLLSSLDNKNKDLVICSDYNLDLLKMSDDLSDHLPCLLSLTKLELEWKRPDLVWKRSLKEKNIKKIELKLRQNDWNLILENKSCEDAFNIFHDCLIHAIDECAPEKPVRKRPTRENQPWITSGLKRCIRKQRELYKSYLEASANIQNKEAYKKYKACLQKVIRNCKCTYYSDLCEKYRNNTK